MAIFISVCAAKTFRQSHQNYRVDLQPMYLSYKVFGFLFLKKTEKKERKGEICKLFGLRGQNKGRKFAVTGIRTCADRLESRGSASCVTDCATVAVFLAGLCSVVELAEIASY